MSEPETVFDRLNPKDGFHVVEINLGVSVALHCQAYGNGELYNLVDETDPTKATVQIAEWMGPGPAEFGQCTRLRLVLEAVARYLTTGGCWDELTQAMRAMSKVAINGMAYPGYHLLESYVTSEWAYQHIFVRDGTNEAVLWEEPTPTERGTLAGGFIDRTTLEKIREQQENDQSVWGDTELAGATDAPNDPVQLLGIADLEPEENAERSPE